MKKIICIFLGVALMGLPSCFKLDNWDEPSCTWSGTVYDAYTGAPLLASQDDWQIRIWERSWTGHPGGAVSHQELRIKQDGTYQNTKLFAGTYDMLPYNGPFWPVDTIKGLVLKGTLKHDFTVIPYLQIADFDYSLVWNQASGRYRMLITFKVKVPSDQQGNVVLSKNGVALPQLRDVRAFVSLNSFCGAGSNSFLNIDGYSENDLRINNTKSWADLLKEGNGTDTTGEYGIFCDMKPDYTFYLRVGARVNDTYQKYNYSQIVRINVPKAP